MGEKIKKQKNILIWDWRKKRRKKWWVWNSENRVRFL